MGTSRRLFPVLLMIVALVNPILADKRTDNIDVIVALDRSLSMEKKVDAVKDWVNSYLIDQQLISGDLFVVVAFYGKAEVIISQTVKDETDKQTLKKTISKIRGNGRFTDIGNALDVLKTQIEANEKDGRSKYVLLLTDGIQEAPPTSKYYSKDGKFNHEFLLNTKTIQEKGWKIMILGIGTETAAKDLAKELNSSYDEIKDTLTLTTLTEKTDALFGAIELSGAVKVSLVHADGSSMVAFTLKTSGLKTAANVTIGGISARLGTTVVPSLIATPYAFTVKASGNTSVRIPVAFPSDLAPGVFPGTLAFTFLAGSRFTPSEAAISITVSGWIGNNLPLFIAGVVILLIIAVLAALLVRILIRGKPLRFAVVVGNAQVAGSPATLAVGSALFLNELEGKFSLIRKRNARSIARLSAVKGKLSFGVLKPERFPKLKEIPPDARGRSFVVRSERGQNTTLKIQSKERAK